MPRGGAVFRNNPGGWVATTLTQVAASQTLTIPDYGTHLEIECALRSDNAAATVNVAVTWNGDTTSGNYHWQRGGGSNNTAVSAEGTSSAVCVTSAGTGVTGAFSWLRIVFPWVRDTGKLRQCVVTSFNENADDNKTMHLTGYRRITAGSGALTDRVSTITFTPSAGNWDVGSIFRYRVVS